jgi:putative DNA primase/helicase
MDDVAELAAPFAPLKFDEMASVARAEAVGELLQPVPADAPPMPQTHSVHGRPTMQWLYHDVTGAALFAISRFDKADGSKEFLPLTLWRIRQDVRWCWKSVPAPRPLYNLEKLAARPDAAVVVCEGEKSADAASLIFPKSVATTSPGGAHAAEKADWTPLRGNVLIWPDDDAPGRTYAGTVGSMLVGFNC